MIGLLVLAGSAWATPSLEGMVKDPNRKPVKNAEVRIEAKNGGTLSKITRSDATGHYVFAGLPAGTYRVTLLVDGMVKATINNAATKSGESTQLNFDLKQTDAANVQTAKKKTHMVYMPADTGSHIGGRWVEVDDQGNAVTAGADNVQKAGNNAIRNLQNPSGSGMTNAGGH